MRVGPRVLEEDEEPYGRPDQGVDQELAHLAARVAELGGVGAQPVGDRFLQTRGVHELLDAGGADPQGLELLAHLSDDARYFFEKTGQRPHAATGEADDQQDDSREGDRGHEAHPRRGHDLGHPGGEPLAADQPEGPVEQGVGQKARQQ